MIYLRTWKCITLPLNEEISTNIFQSCQNEHALFGRKMCNFAKTCFLDNFCGRYFGQYNAVWSIFSLFLLWSIFITTPLAALFMYVGNIAHALLLRSSKISAVKWQRNWWQKRLRGAAGALKTFGGFKPDQAVVGQCPWSTLQHIPVCCRKGKCVPQHEASWTVISSRTI